ncbi:MAG: methionyl-tRNA formyltransferase [Coriobacteriia bacterium]|nr:methionyl-tRNA formyltransferase [Coriobacteriia bacterium]
MALRPPPIRILFMGTPEFALPAFNALYNDSQNRFEVCLVLSKPDAPAGRGLIHKPSVISQAALALGIELHRPKQLKGLEYQHLLQRVEELRIDVAVVTAYGMLLTEQLIEAPLHGTVNIHASLLPRWRGAAPIERAILAGDAVSGVTIQQVRLALDSGSVYARTETEIANKSYSDLQGELALLGASLLVDSLPGIVSGELVGQEQDASLVTYANKVEKHDLLLDPYIPAELNVRRVQAASTRNPARAVIAGRGVRVMQARLLSADTTTNRPSIGFMGISPSDGALLLGTVDGSVAIYELAADGKRPMGAGDFVRGLQIKVTDPDFKWSKWNS